MSEHEDESQQVTPPEAPSEPAPSETADEAPSQELPLEASPSPELAEPGIYWYEGEHSGSHPILGELKQGENDFSQASPEQLAAITAYVASGDLEKMA